LKIAVTAASGQFDASIVNELAKTMSKDNIIGIARTPEKAAHLGIEVRKGDYNSRKDIDAALNGIDAVLLVSGMEDPQKRIQQHRNVIESAKQNGVKKIVYTSNIGNEPETSSGNITVIASNRQTEKDARESGLSWVIGRNGIYIEPDLEYIGTYEKEGKIRNCGGDGKCAYTSRAELAFAYSQLLFQDKHNGQTYNLSGETITQAKLTNLINQVFNTELTYNSVFVEAYEKERKEALGEYFGGVSAGFYAGIKNGVYDVPSNYEEATGKAHKSTVEAMKAFLKTAKNKEEYVELIGLPLGKN